MLKAAPGRRLRGPRISTLRPSTQGWMVSSSRLPCALCVVCPLPILPSVDDTHASPQVQWAPRPGCSGDLAPGYWCCARGSGNLPFWSPRLRAPRLGCVQRGIQRNCSGLTPRPRAPDAARGRAEVLARADAIFGRGGDASYAPHPINRAERDVLLCEAGQRGWAVFSRPGHPNVTTFALMGARANAARQGSIERRAPRRRGAHARCTPTRDAVRRCGGMMVCFGPCFGERDADKEKHGGGYSSKL